MSFQASIYLEEWIALQHKRRSNTYLSCT